MGFRRFVALTLPIVLACSCVAQRAAEPATLMIRLTGGDRAGDRITQSTQYDQTILDVHSRSGIGSAEISPTQGVWDGTLIMRLHLRGLESLSAGNGAFSIQMSVMSRPPYEQWSELVPANGGESERIDETSSFWMPIRIENSTDPQHPVIPLEEGYFELRIPDALLVGNPQTLYVRWIDFFRS